MCIYHTNHCRNSHVLSYMYLSFFKHILVTSQLYAFFWHTFLASSRNTCKTLATLCLLCLPTPSPSLCLFLPLSISLAHVFLLFTTATHTYSICSAWNSALLELFLLWGFSHAPKSLQHFCVHTTFARLEYFYLTRIYCEATVQRVPLPPLVPFTIYLCIAPPFLLSHTLFTHTLRVSSA